MEIGRRRGLQLHATEPRCRANGPAREIYSKPVHFVLKFAKRINFVVFYHFLLVWKVLNINNKF
jgi:hypothetical protein